MANSFILAIPLRSCAQVQEVGKQLPSAPDMKWRRITRSVRSGAKARTEHNETMNLVTYEIMSFTYLNISKLSLEESCKILKSDDKQAWGKHGDIFTS